MKNREEKDLPQNKDRHLDVPQEANRDRHINFLDIEDPSGQNTGRKRKDKETEERQKQWKQGIEEGKKARKESK
jgi:hypothetical protein